MSANPEVPNFGAALAEYIGRVRPEAVPAFLSGLERSAADRYRSWAEAVPEHAEVLMGCAEREDQIAVLIAEAFPVDNHAQTAIDDALPAAVARYYEIFEPYSVRDQLYLQSEAELQGAAAWEGMVPSTDDGATRSVLERCTALERQSSDVVKELLQRLG